MDLRDSLEEFGRMKGAKTDEKGKLYTYCDINIAIIIIIIILDPEEFLNLLFKEVLHIPPFLTIK